MVNNGDVQIEKPSDRLIAHSVLPVQLVFFDDRDQAFQTDWISQRCPCDAIQMSRTASFRFWRINIISNIY